MIKLIRYLRVYIPLLLLAVLLLFGQAILDLSLPTMMSNIVNVGIQQSGIEEIAPRAIALEYYSVLNLFMDEHDFAAVSEAYAMYSALEPTERIEISRTFPDADANQALILVAEDEVRDAADEAFRHAYYAFADVIQTLAATNNIDFALLGDTQANLNLQGLEQLIPSINALPQDVIDDAVLRAKQTPETLTDSVAAVLNKAFYEALGASTGTMQITYILKTGGIMLLLSLAVVVCGVGAGYCFARIGSGMARRIRRDIFAKVNGFTNAEMDSFSTASLITRTTNDITQVQMVYTMGMRMLIFAPIMGIGGVVMALRKSLGMSWIIGVAVALILGIIIVLYAVVMPRFKKMQSLVDRLNLVARENLTGLMVIRAFGTQGFQEKRFDEANKNLTDNSLFVGRAMTLMMPLMMIVMNGITLLVVWFGADQIAQSTMQVGDMMAYIQYVMQIIMSFLFITMIFIMVPRAAVSAERINEVLQSESIIQDPEEPQTLGGKAKGIVSFNDVSFRYQGAEEDVLHHITFTAEPGKTTAIIGSTGSGKSTLVNLIPRFYDASEGSVTLDGIDIRNLTQHELRENIGYVPQKGLLFSGDINSNLRYGDEEADDKTLRQAAEIAQATEFIDTMDEGFASEISQGGSNVSGGQRQRLSIARALVKKAPVYVFDDSFSALDFSTDAKLRAALKDYTTQSSVIVVAQRIASILHADQIIVLDQGKIVGIGRHRELLNTCPAYKEIASSQLSEEELA